MTRLFAAATSLMLLAACFAAGHFDAAAQTRSWIAGSGAGPLEIAFPSSVGAVTFHHEMHFKDLSIKCSECHHQIDAKARKTPHPDYLKSSSASCSTCHKDAGKAVQPVYACSECHRTTPATIADETLSAKVVIHAQCWKCHQVNTGKEASVGCEKCHSGKKSGPLARGL